MKYMLFSWAKPGRGSRSSRDPGFMNPIGLLVINLRFAVFVTILLVAHQIGYCWIMDLLVKEDMTSSIRYVSIGYFSRQLELSHVWHASTIPSKHKQIYRSLGLQFVVLLSMLHRFGRPIDSAVYWVWSVCRFTHASMVERSHPIQQKLLRSAPWPVAYALTFITHAHNLV